MNDNGKPLESFDVKFWIGRWDEKKTIWHKAQVNPLLIKYVGLLDGGRTDLKIFVPLCGKTFDMKWLYDKGHRVVGVEASQLAVEDFFKEQSLEYTSEMRNGIPVFVENSGRLAIYCCDIYDFHKADEGSFDAVWDRGSLAAVNPEDRKRYLVLLNSLKRANCRHLIELYEYDDNQYQGFPFNLPLSKVLELFGERYDTELIATENGMEIAQRLQIEVESFQRNLFLVTLKDGIDV